jgi:hypothetical protein
MRKTDMIFTLVFLAGAAAVSAVVRLVGSRKVVTFSRKKQRRFVETISRRQRGSDGAAGD